ncbi:hypothetical protein RHMOL_Rhmol05G0239900 [Rhododendron molle]|uniref:Uncharacterized protein n=1 Tax=Rhododendron molle TaxID=49168 RepID=A0ACC0NTJ2_RHOML|nr:hypothetical protein RHMOL_Rhmol05G0239900 [Rhododendron molle]
MRKHQPNTKEFENVFDKKIAFYKTPSSTGSFTPSDSGDSLNISSTSSLALASTSLSSRTLARAHFKLVSHDSTKIRESESLFTNSASSSLRFSHDKSSPTCSNSLTEMKAWRSASSFTSFTLVVNIDSTNKANDSSTPVCIKRLVTENLTKVSL